MCFSYAQVIHKTIGAGIMVDGYDASRPLPGICIQKKPGEQVSQLLAWNERFSNGDDRYPRVDAARMNKGTLAATHLNFTLRCFKQGLSSVSTGTTFNIAADDSALEQACSRGHLWWILSDQISEADAVMISEWRSSDNNTSQVNVSSFCFICHV